MIKLEAKVTNQPEAFVSDEQKNRLDKYAKGCFTLKIQLANEEVLVDFVVLPLDQSCFAWCGLSSPLAKLNTLAIGMMLNKAKPVATSIIGEAQINAAEDEASAIRIAKRAGLVAVHFGSSLGNDPDYVLRQFAEKEIVRYLKEDVSQIKDIV